MTTLNFKDLINSSELFQQAFTHKTASEEAHFERLEFLGDALLGAEITKLLFSTYKNESEGVLSRWKSVIVSEGTLARICQKEGLQNYLIHKSKDSLKENPRIQASLLESIIGAIYLEYGNAQMSSFVEKHFKNEINQAKKGFLKHDYKTLFQEKAQSVFKLTPTYIKKEVIGPAHEPTFKVAVLLGQKEFEKGEGASLKAAQMQAAKKAIEKMEKKNNG